MRKTNWNIGETHNGWELLSKEPHVTPNGSKRYHVTVKCPNCGFTKTVTSSISKLNNKGCPHRGMGIRKEQVYDRIYKDSGDGMNLNKKVVARMDGQMLQQIDVLCNEMNVTRSGIIRLALKEYLKSGG